MEKIKRRQFWVNFKFQFQFIMFMLAIALIEIIVFYGIEIYFVKAIFADKANICNSSNQLFEYLNSDIKQKLDLIFLIKSALIIIFLVTGGVLYSHRIAGPLYKMRRHMQDITKGKKLDTLKIQFRRRDFFHEMVNVYNHMIRCLINRSGGGSSGGSSGGDSSGSGNGNGSGSSNVNGSESGSGDDSGNVNGSESGSGDGSSNGNSSESGNGSDNE